MERLAFSERGALISAHPDMVRIFTEIRNVLAYNAIAVLFYGESGTGKELLAHSVHFHSPRKSLPFVAVNCGAIPFELFESTFFGHEKGAFTGAIQAHRGLFEQAKGGTLFLDEVGELPLEAQAKLLRVLQERELTPVGSSRSIPTDTRIISATNRDLKAMMQTGRFREDLYYRLAKYPIDLPPLRERQMDIPILATEIMQLHALEQQVNVDTIHRETMRVFCNYEWPGNVRELDQDIDVAVACHPRNVRRALHHRDLPMNLQSKLGLGRSKARPGRSEVGREVLRILKQQGPLKVMALSQSLGVSPSTVKDALRQLELHGQITVDHRTGRHGNTVRLAESEDRTR